MDSSRTLPSRPARRLVPALTLSAVLVLLAGFGAEEPDDAPAAQEPAATAAPSEPATSDAAESSSAPAAAGGEEAEEPAEELVITISDFAFEVPGTLSPGSAVTVRNEDSVGHTVTSDEEGVFDVLVGPGEEATFTVPEEPGDYPFHCTPHPSMTSTLVIG